MCKNPPVTTSLVSERASGLPTSCACCYCNGSHFSDECSTITQVEARKWSLRRMVDAFSAFVRDIGIETVARGHCRTCKGRHHTSICGSSRAPKEHNVPPSSRTTMNREAPEQLLHSSTSVTSHSTLNPSSPVYNPPLTPPVFCTDTNIVVLLQTATANINNPKDSHCV